ncbi:MAG: type I 3-dehydroquinate dehydratase [Acidobacteria bacterium]|nr:type I 3-dehydroquinate dehydratase [Acidobacteriota bacterium]
MKPLPDKLCVSIAVADPARCRELLSKYTFAEIRLDALAGDLVDIGRIFALPVTLIATCRPGPHDDVIRERRLRAAIEAGAAWVDVEREAPDAWREAVAAAACRHGSRVIVSHHDFAGTPDLPELRRLVADCFTHGADLAKVACRVRAPRENARLLALLDDDWPVVPVGMGTAGRLTRIMAPLLGSPFTFCAPDDGPSTAPGQLTHAEMLAAWECLADE